MTTLILVLAIIAIAFLVFPYLKGRNKSHNEKSAMEKISGTIINKASRNLNELAEGMRDTETVKKELLQAIEQNMKDLKNSYTKHFENLIRSRETYKDIQVKTSRRIEGLKSKIRDLKEKFNSTNDEKYKRQAEDAVRVLIEANRILEKSTNKISKTEEDIEKSKNAYQTATIRLEEKRAEITAIMCSEVISQSYIRDIENELKEKVSMNNIKAESKEMIDGDYMEESNISMEEIQSMYEKI